MQCRGGDNIEGSAKSEMIERGVQRGECKEGEDR